MTLAIGSDPEEHSTWYYIATLFVEAGDVAGYDRHRRALLDRYGATDMSASRRAHGQGVPAPPGPSRCHPPGGRTRRIGPGSAGGGRGPPSLFPPRLGPGRVPSGAPRRRRGAAPRVARHAEPGAGTCSSRRISCSPWPSRSKAAAARRSLTGPSPARSSTGTSRSSTRLTRVHGTTCSSVGPSVARPSRSFSMPGFRVIRFRVRGRDEPTHGLASLAAAE